MDEFTDSDCNLTMLATKSFDHILDLIKTSCLNYQIQISPFSAFISLKKSLIRDKSGKPHLPTKLRNISSEHIEALVEKNHELQRKLSILSNDHTKLINDYDEAHQTIKKLQDLCIKVEADSSDHIKVKELETEISMLKEALRNRDDDILELQITSKAAKEASNKLNGVLSKNRVQYEKEKSLILKEHRAEVKALKKDLGDEIKEKIRLEKKLEEAVCGNENIKVNKKYKKKKKRFEKPAESELANLTNSEILCSICATPILNFQPEYFCGEICNLACQTCKTQDSSWFQDDPFSSFPSASQPASLVSHWIPPPQPHIPQNPSLITSLVSHCVKFPDPGDRFLSMEEVIELMKNLFEEMSDKLKL